MSDSGENGTNLKRKKSGRRASTPGRLTPGNKIAILRESVGLSQEQMAELMSVSRGTISAYENRQNASPSSEALAKIADHFKLDISWFYDGAPTTPSYREAPKNVEKAERPNSDERVFLLEPTTGPKGEWSFTDERNETLGNPMASGKPSDIFRFLPMVDMTFGHRAPQGSHILFRYSPFAPPGALVLLALREPERLLVAMLILEAEAKVPELRVVYHADEESIRALKHDGGMVLATAVGISHPYRPGRSNLEYLGGTPLQFLPEDVRWEINSSGNTKPVKIRARGLGEGRFIPKGYDDPEQPES